MNLQKQGENQMTRPVCSNLCTHLRLTIQEFIHCQHKNHLPWLRNGHNKHNKGKEEEVKNLTCKIEIHSNNM